MLRCANARRHRCGGACVCSARGLELWAATELGWRRALDLSDAPPDPALPRLVFRGPFRCVRHPQSLGLLLILAGTRWRSARRDVADRRRRRRTWSIATGRAPRRRAGARVRRGVRPLSRRRAVAGAVALVSALPAPCGRAGASRPSIRARRRRRGGNEKEIEWTVDWKSPSPPPRRPAKWRCATSAPACRSSASTTVRRSPSPTAKRSSARWRCCARRFRSTASWARSSASRAGAGARWIIDPIDGTKSFIRGIPFFATLIALEEDGEITTGAIYAPALDDLLYAQKGQGAYDRHGRLQRVVGRHAVAFHAGVRRSQRAARPRHLGVYERLVDRSDRQRAYGDFFGYTFIARGQAEAMIDVDLKPWDLAAAARSSSRRRAAASPTSRPRHGLRRQRDRLERARARRDPCGRSEQPELELPMVGGIAVRRLALGAAGFSWLKPNPMATA